MNKFIDVLKLITIHPLLWFVIALAIMTGHFIELFLFLTIIFIHELGHAFAAAFFSWRIKRIVLLPFGGVAELDEHGNRPLKEEAIVTLSGPLQHLWLMGLAFIFHEFSLLSADLYKQWITCNLMVLLFNLLPIWPLDGGKFVYLWRSLQSSFPTAHRITLILSFVHLTIFSLVLLFFSPLNLNLWIILAFLTFSLYYEWKQKRYVFIRFLLERYYGKKVEFSSLKPIVVREDMLVIDILEQFQRGYKHLIVVEKDGSETVQLDENELLHAFFTEKRLSAKIGELLYNY